jgi:hypothetical protein
MQKNVLITERGGAIASGRFRPAMQAQPRAVTKTMKGNVKMKLNTVLTIALAMFIVVGTANAADRYFRGTTDQDWNETGNWSSTSCTGATGASLPGDSDYAVICDGVTCNLDMDDKVGTLDVQGAGVLNTGTYDLEISAAGGLQLSNALAVINIGSSGVILCSEESTGTTHSIDGQVYLEASSSLLQFTADSGTGHTITGDGAIVGEDGSAQIEIASAAKTLTSGVAIEGQLQISGVGNFTNAGTVEANAAGTVDIAITGELDDTDGANRWKASSENAILKFNSSITSIGGSSLQGEFVISGHSSAKIQVDEPLTVQHRLKMSNGVLDVNQNLTMGSGTNYMLMTGGYIDVVSGATFTHY